MSKDIKRLEQLVEGAKEYIQENIETMQNIGCEEEFYLAFEDYDEESDVKYNVEFQPSIYGYEDFYNRYIIRIPSTAKYKVEEDGRKKDAVVDYDFESLHEKLINELTKELPDLKKLEREYKRKGALRTLLDSKVETIDGVVYITKTTSYDFTVES